MSSETVAVAATFPPILPGQATLRSPSNTPLLRNLSLECSPQTLECWERGGADWGKVRGAVRRKGPDGVWGGSVRIL